VASAPGQPGPKGTRILSCLLLLATCPWLPWARAYSPPPRHHTSPSLFIPPNAIAGVEHFQASARRRFCCAIFHSITCYRHTARAFLRCDDMDERAGADALRLPEGMAKGAFPAFIAHGTFGTHFPLDVDFVPVLQALPAAVVFALASTGCGIFASSLRRFAGVAILSPFHLVSHTFVMRGSVRRTDIKVCANGIRGGHAWIGVPTGGTYLSDADLCVVLLFSPCSGVCVLYAACCGCITGSCRWQATWFLDGSLYAGAVGAMRAFAARVMPTVAACCRAHAACPAFPTRCRAPGTPSPAIPQYPLLLFDTHRYRTDVSWTGKRTWTRAFAGDVIPFFRLVRSSGLALAGRRPRWDGTSHLALLLLHTPDGSL